MNLDSPIPDKHETIVQFSSENEVPVTKLRLHFLVCFNQIHAVCSPEIDRDNFTNPGLAVENQVLNRDKYGDC